MPLPIITPDGEVALGRTAPELQDYLRTANSITLRLPDEDWAPIPEPHVIQLGAR